MRASSESGDRRAKTNNVPQEFGVTGGACISQILNRRVRFRLDGILRNDPRAARVARLTVRTNAKPTRSRLRAVPDAPTTIQRMTTKTAEIYARPTQHRPSRTAWHCSVMIPPMKKSTSSRPNP